VTTVPTVEGLISNASYFDGSNSITSSASDGRRSGVTRKKLRRGVGKKKVEILVAPSVAG
jgi:hypothetical protein